MLQGFCSWVRMRTIGKTILQSRDPFQSVTSKRIFFKIEVFICLSKDVIQAMRNLIVLILLLVQMYVPPQFSIFLILSRWKTFAILCASAHRCKRQLRAVYRSCARNNRTVQLLLTAFGLRQSCWCLHPLAWLCFPLDCCPVLRRIL